MPYIGRDIRYMGMNQSTIYHTTVPKPTWVTWKQQHIWPKQIWVYSINLYDFSISRPKNPQFPTPGRSGPSSTTGWRDLFESVALRVVVERPLQAGFVLLGWSWQQCNKWKIVQACSLESFGPCWHRFRGAVFAPPMVCFWFQLSPNFEIQQTNLRNIRNKTHLQDIVNHVSINLINDSNLSVLSQ